MHPTPSGLLKIGKQVHAGEEVPQPRPFPSKPGSYSAPWPPEGARSLSEPKPRRRLRQTRPSLQRMRCGGAATSERTAPGRIPVLGADSVSIQGFKTQSLDFPPGRARYFGLRVIARSPPPGHYEHYGQAVHRVGAERNWGQGVREDLPGSREWDRGYLMGIYWTEKDCSGWN